MFKRNIIVSLRLLKKDIGYSLINIIGLVLGLTVTILIFLWITDEVNFDRFHKNIDEIYRVYEQQALSGIDSRKVYYTPGPLAPELRDKFPQIKRVGQLTPIPWGVTLSINNEKFYDTQGFFGDQEALDIFSFTFIQGNAESALTDPNSIVLSKENADFIFGDQNSLGKSILINSNHIYTVRGVIDKPQNTHLNFSFIIPFEGNREKFRCSSAWQDNNYFTYLQIDRSIPYKEVEKEIAQVVAQNGQENITLSLEPLRRSYLYNIWGTGAINNVKIFSVVAVMVLFIACFNFINLTIARSSKRAREIVLRKVLGGNRRQLIVQFLCETTLLIIISLIVALILLNLLMPAFNNITGKSINLFDSYLTALPIVISVAIIAGLISGIYPAIILSSYKPLKVFKGTMSKGSRQLRTVLVVLQFTLSVGLMVAATLVNRQLDYLVNKDLGFEKDNIIVVNFNEGGRKKYDILKQELIQLPDVEYVSTIGDLPNRIGSSTDEVYWEGKEQGERVSFYFNFVHFDFIEVFNMQLAEGRAWDKNLSTDSTGVIINQEALRIMGLDNPLGKLVKLWDEEYRIIGVVNNFNFKSLKQSVDPLIMAIAKPWQRKVCIRLRKGNTVESTKGIQTCWEKVYPGQLFRYGFFDQEFETTYQTEKRMMTLFVLFGLLSIIISGLGLLGLSVFMIHLKMKEIAIRKVHGAPIESILRRTVWEFIKWVIIANIAGWTLSYIFIEWWLRGYAYRISIKPDVFVITGLICTSIALITVFYQTLKASYANPVDILKYE